MQDIVDIFTFIVNQILLQTPIFMGLIAFIGLVIARRKTSEIIEHTTKTIAGVAIMSAGASVLVGAVKPIGELMVNLFGVPGLVVWNIPCFVASLTLAPPDYHINVALAAAFTLGLAFTLNLVSVRFTNIKTIYLTPHFMNFIAVMNVVAVSYYFPNLDLWAVVLISALAAWLYEWIAPEIGRRLATRYWIPNDAYTVGHSETIWAAFVSVLGRAIGNPEESAEKVELPGTLKVLGDYIIMAFIVSILMFVPIVLLAGPELTPSGTTHYVLWAVMQAVNFTAGVVVLITGVRLFIGSMIPAFKGISERVIPGAVPALDCPVIFPLGPRALLIGALGSLVTAPIITYLMIVTNWPVIVLPNAIWIYFEGGTMGIFGDKAGGWKMAFLAGCISAAAQMFLATLIYPLTGPLYGQGFTWHGPDQQTIFGLFWAFLKMISGK
ncbi:MAG: PTS transporter subunit IIC [Candidatus Asgardarchaeia archaeon]